MIHPSAVIDDSAIIGENVSIGPFCVIGSDVEIGDGCILNSHVVLQGPTVLGKNNHIFQFATVGEATPDLKYKGEQTRLVIGDNNVIREGVTIHRSIEGDGVTRVGEKCFLMGYSHVAHDCQLGDRSVLANGVLLGGHVELGKDVFLGGGSAIHQFIRIGAGAMIGGKAEISLDVAPQLLVSGRNAVSGLNLIGLRRRKYNREDIANLKNAYRSVFKAGNLMLRAQSLLADSEEKEGLIHEFLLFFTEVNRGFARPNTSISDNQ